MNQPLYTLFGIIRDDVAQHKFMYDDQPTRYYVMLRCIIGKETGLDDFNGRDSINHLYINEPTWKYILLENGFTEFDILLFKKRLSSIFKNTLQDTINTNSVYYNPSDYAEYHHVELNTDHDIPDMLVPVVFLLFGVYLGCFSQYIKTVFVPFAYTAYIYYMRMIHRTSSAADYPAMYSLNMTRT